MAWVRDWGGIRTFTLQAVNSPQAMLTTAWETIRGRAVNAFQSMATGTNGVWGSIISAAAAARDAILGIISSIADRVTGLV